MLARHAESLFWSGRYLERAEDTVRMLDVTYHGSLQATPTQARHHWGRLLDILRLRSDFDELIGGEPDEAAVLRFLLVERRNPGSIVSAVASVRENFRALREQLPSELWEQANRFHLELTQRDLAGDIARQPYGLYDLVKLRCQTLAGIIAQSMPRDDGYCFLVTGSMLERALMTGRLLAVRYPGLTHATFDELAQTLRSVSALEEYRRAWRASTDPVDVAGFLLQSPTFPRSMLYCLEEAEQLLELIDHASPASRTETHRLLGRLRSGLEFADVRELVADLQRNLRELEEGIRQVADEMASQYFRTGEDGSQHAQFLLPGGNET